MAAAVVVVVAAAGWRRRRPQLRAAARRPQPPAYRSPPFRGRAAAPLPLGLKRARSASASPRRAGRVSRERDLRRGGDAPGGFARCHGDAGGLLGPRPPWPPRRSGAARPRPAGPAAGVREPAAPGGHPRPERWHSLKCRCPPLGSSARGPGLLPRV